MPRGPFLPSDFVPTKFSTAAEKADFGNALLHFIESEWGAALFTKNLYNRLSMCFGHIAHYNRSGFYETWFTSDRDRLRFLRHALDWPCWGDPEFTFCDVERAIQEELRKRNHLARYEIRAVEAERSHDLAMLERLEAKYRTVEPGPVSARPEHAASKPSDSERASNSNLPIQASLF